MSSRRLALLFLALLAPVGLPSCQRDAPSILTAELLSPAEPGNPFVDETVIRVELDRPVPVEVLAPRGWKTFSESIRITPSVPCFLQASPPPDHPADAPLSRVYLRVRSHPEALRPVGLFDPTRQDPSAPTGLGLSVGTSRHEWVDLQVPRRHPRLDLAHWEDVNGNWIVDEGDALHLQFDRPVELARPEGDLVHVPGDLFLSSPEDRLARQGNEDLPVELIQEAGRDPVDSVRLILGPSPRLVPSPSHKISPHWLSGSIPGSDLRPSSLALRGTPLQPFEKIRARETGLGAISDRAIGLELPASHPAPVPRVETFPEPGPRSFLTATPVHSGEVLLVGGRGREGTALDQVLRFLPDAPTGQGLVSAGPDARLGQGRYLHSATSLPGEDGQMGTPDDLVVILGGMDGSRATSRVEVIRRDPATGDYRVESPEFQIDVPRYDHTATRVRGNEILLVGGTRAGGPILRKAELIAFETTDEGRVRAYHLATFPLPPRARHTTTSLSRPGDTTALLLLYGGLGRPGVEVDIDESGLPLTLEVAPILGSPLILSLRPDGTHSLVAVDMPYSFSRLRYDHRALALSSGGASRVLLTGGSIRPLYNDLRRHISQAWEAPRDRSELGTEFLEGPDEQEAAHSLLFTLDPVNPSRSRVEVLDSTSGELRVGHALLALPGLGALGLGGESPRRDRDRDRRSSGELVLEAGGAPRPFTVFLNSPRSRFAAVALGDRDHTRIFLFGGDAGRGVTLPDIVEISLR